MWKAAVLGLCLAVVLAASGEQDRLVTDRDVRYGGEGLKDKTVAMSCRAGRWVEEFEHGIFKPDDYALLRTKDEGVDILVPRARKAVLEGLSGLDPGAEITVYGKVHWAKGIDPYLVIHEWKKGFSQPYEPKEKREAIVLDFGGKPIEMECGKTYTLVTPKGEKIEASWSER